MDVSVYDHAIEIWSKADLSSLQKELDNDVLELKEKEGHFLESRKLLAAETKKFKKLDDATKLAQVNKIIKQYQKEIDGLTARSKFSEQIIFDVYSKLSEAPDPKPLLQNSIDKLSKVDDNKELNDKIVQLEEKLAKRADYENIKSRLLDMEQNSAVILTKRLNAKEQEVNSNWEEKQRNWKDREKKLNEHIESLQEANRALKEGPSKHKDFERSSEDESRDGNTTISPTEYNFLSEELQSAQSRIFQLEKRNEELNGLLAKATSASERESELQSKKLKIGQLESENALLSASIEKERNSSIRTQNELTEKLQSVEAELNSYKSEVEVIRRKLNMYSDYNSLKEELSALKKIEFGVDDAGEDEVGESNRNLKSDVEKVRDALVAANKKLQSNVVDLRNRNRAQEEENLELRRRVEHLDSKIRELEELNTKLELDLEKVDVIDSQFNDTSSLISGATRQMNIRRATGGRLSPTSSIVGIPENDILQTNGNSSSILPLITKQRDRFKARITDLEKQIRQLNIEKNKVDGEMQKLEQDNRKLYEKVRYLSSYNVAVTPNGGSKRGDIDTESQYALSYEESLHPLANFKRNEMEYYKRNRLSIWEKLFITFANVILQNKFTRMVFFVYCIFLHGLVFIMSMYVINLTRYLTPDVGAVSVTSPQLGKNIAV